MFVKGSFICEKIVLATNHLIIKFR